MKSYKFSAYQLDRLRDEATNERNFPPVEVPLSSISRLGHRCINRTLYQITTRLPKPSVEMGMSLLFDPRMKRAAANYLRVPENPECADKILEEAKELLRKEHRFLYRIAQENDNQENRNGNVVSVSRTAEPPATFDTDMELLCGDENSQQTLANPFEDEVNCEADVEVEKWLNHRVDWAEVVKLQITDKDERNEVLVKLTIRNREGKSVWNVEQLCQYINVYGVHPRHFMNTFSRRLDCHGPIADTY
ncbi:hypothetical protein F441_12929 [Phytophthora nicotianae CJ01A1]|uniref:Uncharacterized protein n=1 Tax=Phytophthora nicotianae CJ01A1 TaxID=1317063 RepID=W2WN43_PHYNI|nr:hypothetical protein F441_12929 [Phytophthora nicotianae CJ01A1]